MVEYKNEVVRRDLDRILDFKEKVESIADDIEQHLVGLFSGVLQNQAMRIAMPKIVFDNDCPHDRNRDGNMPLWKIKNALVDLISGMNAYNTELEKALKDLKEIENEAAVEEIIKYIRWLVTDEILGYEEPRENRDLVRKSAKILKGLKTGNSFLTAIAGEYHDDSNTIVLYYNNMNCDINNQFGFFVKIKMTLAHELFHAFHYSIARSQCREPGCYSLIVKEASADFYAFLYCFYLGTTENKKEANYRYVNWKEWFISNWPYSKALYYLNLQGSRALHINDYRYLDYHDFESYGSVNKLCQVIQLSKTSMDFAYHALIYDDDNLYSACSEKTRRKRKLYMNDCPENYIVEFSHTYNPEIWMIDSPPVKYTVKLQESKLEIIHYKIGKPYEESYRTVISVNPVLVIRFFDKVNKIDWSSFNYRRSSLWKVALEYNNMQTREFGGGFDKPIEAESLATLIQEMIKQI